MPSADGRRNHAKPVLVPLSLEELILEVSYLVLRPH